MDNESFGFYWFLAQRAKSPEGQRADMKLGWVISTTDDLVILDWEMVL